MLKEKYDHLERCIFVQRKRQSAHPYLQLGGLKLGLAQHFAYSDKWICHLHPLFVTHVLEAEELEAAQREAVALAKEHIQQVVSDLESVG